MFEYVRGINSENELAKRKQYIRRIKKTTLGGNIFPDPVTYLQLAAGRITRQICSEKSSALIGLINNFLAVKTVQVLHREFRSFLQNTAGIIKSMNDDSAKVKDLISHEFQNSPNRERFKTRLSHPPTDTDCDIMAPHLLNERYGLNVKYTSEKRSEILQAFPSIKYMCDIYWKYFGHLVISRAKPRESDIFDMAQVVYLNRADYFVTRDGRLRKLVNECGNTGLKDRAISSDDFILMLDKSVIVKRAPQAGSSFWVNAPF